MADLLQSALRESLATTKSYRACLHAALDQLHLANTTIERQQRQIQEMREERDRYARAIFPDAGLKEQA